MAKLNYVPVRQGTVEWLEARRQGITASEMPILTGNREGLIELWAYKIGDIEHPQPVDPKVIEMFVLGHALEPVIATQYTKKTGRQVRRVNQMVRADDPEWAFASLDRITVDHDRIVELKWAAIKRWQHGVPDAVMDQVQWQMFVTGIERTDVAVLNGGAVEIHEVLADKAYQSSLLTIAHDFRSKVVRKVRPGIDGSDSTRRVLHRLHPIEKEEVITSPDSNLIQAANELRDAQIQYERVNEELRRRQNRMKSLLGDHGGVVTGDVRVTWKSNKDSKVTDWETLAREMLSQQSAYDALHAIDRHTKVVPGNRVMRVRWDAEEEGEWT